MYPKDYWFLMLMRLHRFFYRFNKNETNIELRDADLVNQIKNVLRLKGGDFLILVNGENGEARAKVTSAGKKSVVLEVIDHYKNKNEPETNVSLFCGVLKKENFELAVQKATEIGVKEFFPILTERTVKMNLNVGRLKKIVKEAAEQSGRGIVPVLHSPIVFKEALNLAKNKDTNLFFDLSGSPLKSQDVDSNTIGIFIGPEGGWSEEEIVLAKEAGFKIVSLGKLTLRAETAAIVGAYLVCRL